MATALETHTVLPPQAGGDELEALASGLDTAKAAFLVGTDGTRYALPDEVRTVLRDAIAALSLGQAITIMPHNTLLTTQEAADILKVSRPTLVKLLDAGKIAYERPGRHRRVQLANLLDYQHRIRRERRAILDEMTRDASPDDAYAEVAGFVETR